MTSETIPLEAGIEGRAISMTKGCYVGQEVIIRILHRGHGRVARRLAGLMVDGTARSTIRISARGRRAGGREHHERGLLTAPRPRHRPRLCPPRLRRGRDGGDDPSGGHACCGHGLAVRPALTGRRDCRSSRRRIRRHGEYRELWRRNRTANAGFPSVLVNRPSGMALARTVGMSTPVRPSPRRRIALRVICINMAS